MQPSPVKHRDSMSLLSDTTLGALDPSYAAAAAQRTGPAHHRRVPVIALLVAIGVVTGTAAAQSRERGKVGDEVRDQLLADVREATAATDALSRSAADLRRDVGAVSARALGQDASGRRAAEQVAALELATGATAVSGPGVVVTLDDADDAASDDGRATRGGQLGDGRIFDRDVQDVVNALWAAGAEAISVNGLRLTARTAIRSAGEAVLVDFRPLSPPYLVRAIGDPDRLEPAFVDSPTGRRFTSWTSLYGLGFAVAAADDLRLPAAGDAPLRVAVPGGAP